MKTAQQIVTTAFAAAESARSVHIVGAIHGLRFDLYLVAGVGGRGHLDANGLAFDLIRIGREAYWRGGDAFWRHVGGVAGVQLFHDRWVKEPATKAKFASLTMLTNLRGWFKHHASSSRTKLDKGGTQMIDGRRAIVITDMATGKTFYVATEGRPYPLAIKQSGRSGGTVTFSAWDRHVALSAPENAIDGSKVHG